MISRLLAQFSGKKNLEGLLRGVGTSINDLEEVFFDLNSKRWIDTAEGVQLDGVGTIVGRDRIISEAIEIPFFGFAHQISGRGFGQARFRRKYESWKASTRLNDAEYRKILYAKIAKNTSNCTLDEVIHLLQIIFEEKNIIVEEIGNAKISVAIGRLLNERDIIFANSTGLMARAGGVGIFRRSFFNGQFFGFKHQKYATGFNQLPFATKF